MVDVALEVLAGVVAEGGEPLALDVGTGSGCIALALAAEDPFVALTAVDISGAAVELARRNAARLGLGGRVRILRSDLFAALPPEERYDVIVSNPPYIPAAEYDELEPNVRDHEPRLALHGGEDGLDVYRRLIPEALARLRSGGTLALEVGAGEAAAVRALFAADGGYGAPLERVDLAGIPRVVWAAKAA